MTGTAFGAEVLRRLEEDRRRRPVRETADDVKFVFQALLGVGHLLAGRETAAARAAAEMGAPGPDPTEPLLEPLSPAWQRLNLRPALAEGLSADDVAGLMLASPAGGAAARQDVCDICRGAPGIPADDPVLRRVPDEGWLPSHSAAYRDRYRPAYRVIAADWAPRMRAVTAVAAAMKRAGRVLVTLDGPCGSGKTTFAERLAAVFGGTVVHTDHFVVPHARKTPERLAMPGGNCDVERLAGEVAVPWKADRPVRFRRYDWSLDALLPPEVLPDSGLLIIEGSYCNLPPLRALADVRLFMATPGPVRMDHLARRESPESMARFRDRWIPLENAYFAAYHLPDEGCILCDEESRGV